MDEQDIKSLVLYYGRAKYFHTMQNEALIGVTRYPADLTFRLFNGLALVLGNRVQEGIRELNPLQGDSNFSMAAILALMFAHKRCSIVDKEALSALENRFKDERRKLTASAAYFAGVFLLLNRKYEKCREFAEKALKLNNQLLDAYVLKGWAELSIDQRLTKSTLEIFEQTLARTTKHMDASLGQVRFHQLNNDFEAAITVLNKLAVRYPDLNIPLIEKMKSQLAIWNWDQAMETASRVLAFEPNNIDAAQVRMLVLICRDGNYAGARGAFQILQQNIYRMEPTNSDLFVATAQLFARVCDRNTGILDDVQTLIERAVKLSPGNPEYLIALGFNCILLNRIKEANKYFKTATKADDSSTHALCGLTLCQMTESGATDQVHQQIEFLDEVQGSSKNALLLLMTARLNRENSEKAIGLLVQACELHFKNLKTLSFGVDYLRLFDPDFLLEVVRELLLHSPVQATIQASSVKEQWHTSLKHSLDILEAIVKACPGLVQGIYLLAKVQFLCGEVNLAVTTLETILREIDPTKTEAHLMIAQIYIQQDAFARAAQSLEVCLSHNLNVRENSMYHLLNGIIQKNQNQLEDSLKSFTAAIQLSGLGGAGLDTPTKRRLPVKTDENILSLSDKVTLYLELVDTHMLMGQHSDAIKLMQVAMNELKNSPEEGRVIIANADIILKQGDATKVIQMLGEIQPGHPYYIEAKTKMAHVYLHQRKDQMAFAQCFKELVLYCPESKSYLMLGDAYMSIQEPDLAIDAFTQALCMSPNDASLASKLGRAFVKTHQYAKAIQYYNEAIVSPQNAPLKLDLAELYLKLKQYSNAEQTLIDDIDSGRESENDTNTLQNRTKQLLLLARVREKSGYLAKSVATLKEARDNQYRVQNRMGIDAPGNMQEQQRVLSKICVLMAEQSISLRDDQAAVAHYKEALKYSPQDLSVLASLARLYMQINNMDLCQQTCGLILQSDPKNETASVIMADLSFRRMDFDNAAYHFSQLLLGQPTYWTALARLLEVMRRSATLHEMPEFLQRAEQGCTVPTQEAGLNYCKGLYEWFSGNPNSALRFFNNARRDHEWGQQAIFNMIEICLNPDGDLPHESVTEAVEDAEMKDSRGMALRTAERLLKELKPRPGGMDNEALNHRLLQNFLLISTRQKNSIEAALEDFMGLAAQEEYKNHVGPILGVASAHILLKQSQRARNHLKRVSKNTWTFEDAEYLERCWLVLADLYIQSGKYEIASELLQKVLHHNKSCAKAYELCGFIAEKEQSYRAAAVHYESAWRLSGKSKAAIGYKLAYNFMKAKRYADAINVCQQVIKMHPDYTAIKKDIFDKCRNNLKT